MKLNLAPLVTFNAPPAPVSNSTNPGCTDPASQSYSPPQTDQAISRAPCTHPTITSTGEVQLANQHLGNASSGTVTVSVGGGTVVQASGETSQFPDKQKTVRAVSTGRGLPRNVLAGNKNHSKFIPPEIAVATPPAIDVAAGSGHPGGLPTNVNIK